MTLFGFVYKKMTLSEILIASARVVIARGLKIAPKAMDNLYYQIRCRTIKKRYLVNNGNTSCFDIMGAKLPDISNSKEKMKTLALVFEDSFLIPVFYNDNYDKTLVNKLDRCTAEGPYGYTDCNFDVTVKSGDIVIDAGAWIGDFSAYATTKNAIVYAFEPSKESFALLCETAKLNGDSMIPIQKGLSNMEGEVSMSIDSWSGGSSIVMERSTEKEIIHLTTIDQFVEDHKLEKVDFIKADIEGAERDMLRGATNVLKTFAPKLAICTYHFPDDPQILEQIIKEANPNYTVVHLRHKLFAAVV